jgi:FlaA1/EpsC-like NDP-sugar epimerase
MKNRYVLLADLPLIAAASFGAYAVRFDWRFYEQRPEFALYLLVALVIKPAIFLLLGMYQRYWRYASVQELVVVVIAVTASSMGMAIAVMLVTVLGVFPHGFSRTVVFTDWLLTLVLTGGLRLAIRVVHESSIPARRARQAGSPLRILIVGAGAAGTMVAREMRRNPQLGMEPAGFLDDDGGKIGKRMAGLRVLGDTRMLPDLVRSERIDSVVIAMPTARGSAVRAILDMCNEAGVRSQTVPGMFELLDGQVSVNRLRNVEIADLLRRSPVDGGSHTADFVAGRVVLITGAGGSIGSELARQIAGASPSHLVLLGHGENSIFEAEARLRAAFPHVHLSTVIADIREDGRLARVFDRIRPDVVFHAAAHKHVPLMEENPEEAITNNVIGTRNVVNQVLRAGTERLVFISTDKAVLPTSVMGASKRIAEAIVRQAARRSGRAFVTVRFGNVLGSRGSVVSTFKTQIEQGGPVTVTHREMTRFFMTIPEAVHLVLQASGKGSGGELFVLDMGEPVKIVQLAQDLIRLSGLGEDEVPIVFTGVRPGEKMHELLFDPDMQTRPTSHPAVLEVIGPDTCVGADLDGVVCQLEEAAMRGDRAAIDSLLWQTIPGFVPDGRLRGAHAADRTH